MLLNSDSVFLLDLKKVNNIKILNSDIVPFLEETIPDDSFDLVLMFYPDPWPKRKHHKRRLLQSDFLNLIHSKLKKNGIFYFKTDWSHYYQESSKILLDDKNWLILDESDLTPILKAIPITSFERKALKAQRDLKKIILKKIS